MMHFRRSMFRLTKCRQRRSEFARPFEA